VRLFWEFPVAALYADTRGAIAAAGGGAPAPAPAAGGAAA
jgi:hypothetical protein